MKLAREQDAYLPTYDVNKIKKYLVVTPDAKDRSSFFRRHDLSQAVLQGRKAIRRVVSELVIDMERQGVLYAEIRMTPQAHTLRGLTQNQVVEAALEGLNKGMELCRSIRANLVCARCGELMKRIILPPLWKPPDIWAEALPVLIWRAMK